jgi:predicted amidohydrolase
MRVALCQLPISPEPAINLDRVAEAVASAARQGADLAVFPEATQARFGSDLRAVAEPLDGAFGRGLAALARDSGVALVAGVFEPAPDGRVYNTAVAYTGSGELAAAYRKIHLFDSLGERESAMVAPGSEPVVAELAGVRTGFATCYDIRFPELARALVARGAELIVVPTAWAAGLFKEEHWVTLVRARAIENTVWVAAAGQVPDPASPPTRAPTGVGRSMLVDPMGTVRADLGLWPQVIVAELDSELTARARAVLPCLEHRRDDIFGPADPAAAAGLAAAAGPAGMGAPAGVGGPAGMGAPAGTAGPVSRSAPATERDAARSR